MSDIIRLLPDSVANQIAAGEVIQRPASVIKELVENSIDAGATSITIVLKDAGRTLIQVIDNGKGMSDTDARLAFERHATSKIAKADDLFTLHTMGFRGEALASIAAIAQVDLRTMQRGESIGSRIIINGSKVESQEPEACVEGCNMMVKNLFFNVPARRKFLKKDAVEMSAIMREFERLALVNTAVDFTLVSNDVTLHSLRAGSMKQRICQLFGKNLDKQLIPVETDTSIVSISGFVGLPANARKRGQLQYLMVNGRNMRHPYFHKAVMQCYERLIPADEQPNYFLNFRVDPETIDVNIHPTKNEIKFENEQAIWQILTAAIRDSLGRFNAGPAIDFDIDDAPEIPVFQPREDAPHDLDLNPTYNPFQTTSWPPASPDPDPAPQRPASSDGGAPSSPQGTRSAREAANFQNWEKLYDDFMRKRDEGHSAITESKLNDLEEDSPLEAPQPMNIDASPATLQFKNSFIITPSSKGLMVIDQHRAHVRVLYDSYMASASDSAFVAQAAMFPEILELNPTSSVILQEILPRLGELGFVITPRGEGRWSIDGVPSVLGSVKPDDLIKSMIDSVAETGREISETLHEKIALSIARSTSIRRGQELSPNEIDHLISELFKSSSPSLTPDGKCIFKIISADYFTRLLG